MSKLVKIDDIFKIKCNKEIKEFLNPDYIYVPYKSNDKLMIKNDEQVLMNGVILQSQDTYYYSSISGKIVGMCENIVDNKNSDTIVIENDFKEKVIKLNGAIKNISSYTKDELKKIIKVYNAYQNSLNGKTILVSGIDYEPYEFTMSYLISKHTDELLECIDAITNILNIKTTVLALNNDDEENVTNLVNQIGTYPNINLKLLPNLYPIGKRECLIKELNLDPKDVIFFTVEDIYNIYNVLKRKKPITDKLVTISGNLITKSKVMKVKIGTNLGDMLINEFKFKNKDYHIIVNGLLSGYEINSLNYIITPNTRSIFINTVEQNIPSKCINCGMCINYCPMDCNPKEKINMEKCFKCGLCNYICPSKINILGGTNE